MRKPSNGTLLLFVLLVARVRIDTLVEWAAIPTAMLQADVARLVGSLWPVSGMTLLADRQTTDPVTLTLISLAFGLFFIYLLVDMLSERWAAVTVYRVKMGLVVGLIIVLVFGQTILLIGLRHITNPAAYTHDGGVIQTEVTVEYLLAGVNPYVADYLNTPMAAWGTEYRTALYHYPYLPWTFLFSAPFYLLSHVVLGWFDERFVYLLLFAATLVIVSSLARRHSDKLAVVTVVGLNPILASDVIFGQNDSFVLFWIVLALWLLRLAETWRIAGSAIYSIKCDRETIAHPFIRFLSVAIFGLACASKPTAWFLAPFWILYLLRDTTLLKKGTCPPQRKPDNNSANSASSAVKNTFLQWRHDTNRMNTPPDGGRFMRRGMWWLGRLLRCVWPLAAVFALIVGPWFVWDPGAMFDDVWRWSAGTSATPYQIRGWGLSNFILALGLVPDRLAYWPFWVIELLVAAPLLALLLWRQARRNTLATMLHGYVLLLFGFFYVSRFLNENYLGYLLALFAVAYFVERTE